MFMCIYTVYICTVNITRSVIIMYKFETVKFNNLLIFKFELLLPNIHIRDFFWVYANREQYVRVKKEKKKRMALWKLYHRKRETLIVVVGSNPTSLSNIELK